MHISNITRIYLVIGVFLCIGATIIGCVPSTGNASDAVMESKTPAATETRKKPTSTNTIPSPTKTLSLPTSTPKQAQQFFRIEILDPILADELTSFIDFETESSTGTSNSSTDLEIIASEGSNVFYFYKPSNGSIVYQWNDLSSKGLSSCKEIPADEYLDFKIPDLGTSICIYTSDGNLVYLEQKPLIQKDGQTYFVIEGTIEK